MNGATLQENTVSPPSAGVPGAGETWAVIGGGAMGLLLSYRLAKAGRAVTLFEAAPELGGLARAWKEGDIHWDRYYHVILLTDTHLRPVLQELGLEPEIVWKHTRTGFYTDKQHHSMSNAWEFLRFPPLNLIEKTRLVGMLLYASRVSAWKRLEGLLVEDWLRRVAGDRVTDKIWVPLLRAKLGENYKRTSAAFIWATLKRYYGARKTGDKKELCGYVQGGYARIFDRFQEALREAGVTVRVAHAAKQVAAQAGGGVRVDFQNGPSQWFDQVALTVASPVAARLCPALTEDERNRHNGVQYMGIVCASVLLKKPLRGFYVTNITDTSIPFTGVIEMTSLVGPANFGGRYLAYLPKYVDSNDPFLGASDQEVKDLFIPAFLRMYPELSRDDILSFQISREKYVMAIPILNYSERLPAVTTSIPGVHVVNSAQITSGTLTVNETMRICEREVPRLLALPRAAGQP